MALDIGRLRRETPGCEHVAHLNNAGSALMPEPVFAAVVGHLHREMEMGGYEAAAVAAEQLSGAREAVGRLVGAEAADVMITESDTASFAKAFWGLALGGWFDRGGRILADRIAYGSHYVALLQAAERFGLSLETIRSTPDGSLDLEDLDRRLDGSVRLVTATHVATHRGLVNPVGEVGERTRAAGVPFLLDACQSAGQLPVDVGAIGCDVATGTGRKFLRGPRGTGWLYVHPEWSERMVPIGADGTSSRWLSEASYEPLERASRFDVFESSLAGRIGLGVAIDYVLELGMDEITRRVAALAEGLREELGAVGAAVHDGGRVRCGIVTFTVPGHSAPEVKEHLAAAGINVVASEATFSRLDMESRGLPAVVRASPHYYNTEQETARLVGEVARLLA